MIDGYSELFMHHNEILENNIEILVLMDYRDYRAMSPFLATTPYVVISTVWSAPRML